MIDWLAIGLALVIIASLVGIFGLVAWKISMPDPLVTSNAAGKKEDAIQLFDSANDKKTGGKKKRNVKKPKRDTKEEDHRRHSVTFKEPSTPTSDETDNEREESEHDSSTTPQVVETSSKVRRRKGRKANQSSGHIEGILANKNEKSPVTDKPQEIPHPKLAVMIPKDEVELAKQHHQQAKVQTKASQPSNKQTVAAAAPPPPPAPIKKPTPSSTNTNQGVQKQQQQEQPFTTVGGNRHKAATPPAQQQQQQNKPVSATTSAATVPAPSTQQQTLPPVQHEQLAQRQPPRQQKETPGQLNGFNANPLPVKQPAAAPAVAAGATATSPVKLADLVKTLPTSHAVVIELMSALDAYPLSADELNIIMQRIANKQSLIKQDWSKLQHGQKVDPQAHIGQVLDESARVHEEDMRNNAMKRIKELTDECNNDKRRINDLIKESNEKDVNIQLLHVQLNSLQQQQHPQAHIQPFQVELKRLTEENMQLKHRLTQQQQHFQQQQQQQPQLSSMNLINNNANSNDAAIAQLRVVNEQIKKLSVDNGNYEKQLKAKDSAIKDAQKEKDDLIRTNQQLAQKVQESQKQFHNNEEKVLKELNDSRTLHMNQLNEYKRRLEQIESDNEQIRRENLALKTQPQPVTLNNEERDKFQQDINQLKQQLSDENEQYKKKFDDLQSQYQSKENELRQQMEQLKKDAEQRQNDQTQNNELAAKDAQINALRTELEDAKAKNDAVSSQSNEHLRQEQEKYKQILSELLGQDARNQLPNDNQDFNQWLSSYRQIFTSSIESSKRASQDETTALKNENDQLLKNMSDVEKQLKEIEQTVQSKEELLLADLRNKDAAVENLHRENEQVNVEMQRLRAEIDRLQLANESAINENRALKLQLDERLLVTANSPSTTTDDSFEFVKQPSPSSIEIDPRAEELNELIRSSKEALENQDSIVQQLDKHLNEMHRGGNGEISTSNADESTVSSATSDQQQQQQSES